MASIQGRILTTAEDIRQHMVTQLELPVEWTHSVREMIESGVDTFVEIGPGQVLSRLIRKISRDVRAMALGIPSCRSCSASAGAARADRSCRTVRTHMGTEEHVRMSRRVVVTGLGAVTPLGNTVAETWDGFVNGRNGVAPVTLFDASRPGRPARRRGQGVLGGGRGQPEGSAPDGARRPVRAGRGPRGGRRCRAGVTRRRSRSGSARSSGRQPAAWSASSSRRRCWNTRGPDRVAPMFLPYFLPDTASGVIAIDARASRARTWRSRRPARRAPTRIGEAFETIRRDDADVMLAGSTEASLLEGDHGRLHQHEGARGPRRRAGPRQPPVRPRPQRLRDRRGRRRS